MAAVSLQDHCLHRNQDGSHSVAAVADRHAQEALRAELRRLARQWQLRIRTVARDDRVGVTRIDEHPWDDDERAAIQRVNDALGGTRHGP
jgi:hypothetical protein